MASHPVQAKETHRALKRLPLARSIHVADLLPPSASSLLTISSLRSDADNSTPRGVCHITPPQFQNLSLFVGHLLPGKLYPSPLQIILSSRQNNQPRALDIIRRVPS